jgi:DNA repair protein RadA/Sms
VRVDEPGADLAVALAVASAVRGVPLSDDDAPPLACFGELGLTGELRTVAHPERRLTEARKFGLERIVTPEVGTLRKALAGLRERSRSAEPAASVAIC